MKIVNLLSGGIDSYIMCKQFKGVNVYIDYGQSYAEAEMSALKKLNCEFDVVNTNLIIDDSNIFIPARNLFLCSLVTMLYYPDVIRIAGLKDDHCVDKTEDAFEQMSNLISKHAKKKIKIESPYWGKTKGEIVAEYPHKEELRNTFSCYNPINNEHCMNCSACLRRAVALETNGIALKETLKDEIIKSYLEKIHTYEIDRISRFFIYLKLKGHPIVAVDFDGTIVQATNTQKISDKILNKEVRGKMMEIAKDSIIVIYTARLECDRPIIIKILKKHKIPYDVLLTNKVPFDILIDDQSRGNL